MVGSEYFLAQGNSGPLPQKYLPPREQESAGAPPGCVNRKTMELKSGDIAAALYDINILLSTLVFSISLIAVFKHLYRHKDVPLKMAASPNRLFNSAIFCNHRLAYICIFSRLVDFVNDKAEPVHLK